MGAVVYIYIYSLLIIVSVFLLMVLFIPFHFLFEIKGHERGVFSNATISWLVLSHSSSRTYGSGTDGGVSENDISADEGPREVDEGDCNKDVDCNKGAGGSGNEGKPSSSSSIGEKIDDMQKWAPLTG